MAELEIHSGQYRHDGMRGLAMQLPVSLESHIVAGGVGLALYPTLMEFASEPLKAKIAMIKTNTVFGTPIRHV